MEQKIKELVEKGAYAEAIQLLSALIEKEPANDEAWYLRGYVYKQLGKWGESLSDLNRAVELNPDSRAAVLRQLLQDIINFRHTDIYNP